MAASATYAVQPGDTLFLIARRFETTVQAIVKASNIADPNRIFPGQRRIIPVSGAPMPPPAPNGRLDSMSSNMAILSGP